MTTSAMRFGAAIFTFTLLATAAHAQVITSTELERGLRYGNLTPFDGEPTTQRYSYNAGEIWYPFQSSRYLYYMDYLDRVDRAEKFGHRRPYDPFFDGPLPEGEPVVVVPAPRPVRMGLGFGFFRRR